jgi:hypothetical protein
MGLHDLIEEVLLLQPDWSSLNTDDMARRGLIVRQEIPRWLRDVSGSLAQSVGWAEGDLAFEGRDGTGPKTEIPWTRLYSAERKPVGHEWLVRGPVVQRLRRPLLPKPLSRRHAVERS